MHTPKNGFGEKPLSTRTMYAESFTDVPGGRLTLCVALTNQLKLRTLKKERGREAAATDRPAFVSFKRC